METPQVSSEKLDELAEKVVNVNDDLTNVEGEILLGVLKSATKNDEKIGNMEVMVLEMLTSQVLYRFDRLAERMEALESQQEDILHRIDRIGKRLQPHTADIENNDIDVEEFTEHIASLQKNDIHHTAKEEIEKQLKLKTQLAKESLDLADPQAVQFASPQVKAVYDALMPEIREQIEYLDKKLVQGLNELGEALAGLSGESEGRTRSDIGIVANRLDSYISNLQAKLSSIDNKVRDIRSMRGGVYRN